MAGSTIGTGSISGTALGAASNVSFNATGVVTVGGAVGTDIGTLTVTQSGGTNKIMGASRYIQIGKVAGSSGYYRFDGGETNPYDDPGDRSGGGEQGGEKAAPKGE